MEPRRRSARLQAIHNAVSNEEAAVVAKATDPTTNLRKRTSPGNVDGPPHNRPRRSSLPTTELVRQKEEIVKKTPVKSRGGRIVQPFKANDSSDPPKNIGLGTANEKPQDNTPLPEDIAEERSVILENIVASKVEQRNNEQCIVNAPQLIIAESEVLKKHINGFETDRSSSMETFGVDSEGEMTKRQQPNLPPRPPSRNLPRRSRAVVSYKESVKDDIDSTESDLSDSESEDVFDDSEGYEEKKTERTKKTIKRKYDDNMEEDFSDEEDDVESVEDIENDELNDSPIKKKTQRRSTVGDGGGKRSRKTNTTSKVTVRRSSNGVKTPANKGIKPWEKQTGNIIKHKVGDILVPQRPLRRGEQKMLVFRILAAQLAMERKEEIDLNEGNRLLDQIKAEYNEDKEGYIRRVLMTGGRDPDEELESKEASQEKNGESSSSEDEWMEMEPVESDKKKKLEVVLEDKEADGHDWWAVYLRQEVNKKIRQKYEDSHKVNLLCYLAHLQHIVKAVLHEKVVPSLLLSQLPEKLIAFQQGVITKEKAQQLAIWFKSNYKPASEFITSGPHNSRNQEMEHYSTLAGEKCYETDMERSALLFALLDGLGVVARICVNTRPIPRRWGDEAKPTSNKNKKVTEKKDKPKEKENNEGRSKKNKPEEMDYWVEYWNTQENRWICINPINAKVDEPSEIEQATHSPIYYIFAIDNKRGIREVSARYASDFCRPEFRRRRTEGAWLTRTLNCDLVKADENRSKLEDMHFKTEMINRPLPLFLNEYKNHPLYVLEKDLLKFQALYPPPGEQKPLGKVREHNVYPRSTVHTLLGEKKWEKLARSIKEGESPYKIVKAFPIANWKIPKEERVDAYLNVYGYWQTEPFRPPKVENGIIPRNEYGNVYLYQPSMCPIGAVHLRLPGLVQIARRLGKECVPAITGWDFNHCGNWPIVEGACVLEEDKDIFIAESRQMEIEREAREKKKMEERALKNWKKFIQGVVRLHRVKTRFGHPVEEQSKKPRKSKKKEPTPEPVASIIDNTEQPVVKEYTLHDVMGI